MYEEFTYFITLKKKGNNHEIIFNVGESRDNIALLKIGGRNSSAVFRNIVQSLSKYGATVPIKLTDKEERYAIREDLGPVVGSYLILIKRARNIRKWNNFFNGMLSGKYIGIAKAFTSFLEIAIELSRSSNLRGKNGQYSLSPIVVTALSSSLKRFVSKIIDFKSS